MKDIRVEGLSVYGPRFKPGTPQRMSVSARVVNAGTEAITENFRVLIRPGTFNRQVNGLAAGETVYVSSAFVESQNPTDVLVQADPEGVVAEIDRTNNTAMWRLGDPDDVGRWVSIGPTRITLGLGAVGIVTAIAIHPTSPSTIYAGAVGSGAWKTTDGGTSWQPITDSLPTLNVATIAIDPSSPSPVYIVSPHNGVFRSEDAGATWRQISTENLNAVGHDGGALLVDPTNPNLLYQTASDGLRLSRDRGVTWRRFSQTGSDGTPAGATSLVMDRSNPRTLYLALGHRTDNSIIGIYRTTDGGDNWEKLTGCPGGTLPTVTEHTTIRLALSRDRLYASYKTSASWRLFRTTDVGCSIGGRFENRWEAGWNPTHSIGDDPVRARLWGGLYSDPTDPRFVYAGGTDFWFSTDGGKSFERASEPHVDHHAFATDSKVPGVIYTGCDGGVYKSSDRGKTGSWSFISEGLENVQFYDIADAATNPNLLIGGTQDNASIKYDGSSKVWKEIGCCRGALGGPCLGDIGAVAIDPTNEQTFYVVTQQDTRAICRSTNGGEGWNALNSGATTGFVLDIIASGFGSPPNHFQEHPSKPATLLITSGGSLWRTEKAGEKPFEKLTTPTNNIVRFAVDPTIDLYYAGTRDGRLYAGPAGANWKEVFVHPSSLRITDIEIDPEDPATVYVSFHSSTGNGRVYRLNRGSSTAPITVAQTPIASGLPNGLEVRTVAVDIMVPLTIYVGANLGRGVYRGRSIDGGQTWSWAPYNSGMPLAEIHRLEVHPTTGIMRAATFGRGAFEVNTDFSIGRLNSAEGKVTFLRVHDVGTKFGGGIHEIDVEVVIQLDSKPGKSYGFQLRPDANEEAHRGMLNLLRHAFNRDRRVSIDYVRTSTRNGRVTRVAEIP